MVDGWMRCKQVDAADRPRPHCGILSAPINAAASFRGR